MPPPEYRPIEERVPITSISRQHPPSGWRPIDNDRVKVFLQSILDGVERMNVLGGITLLGDETDVDGKRLVDDGLCSVEAWFQAHELWLKDPKNTPNGTEWSANARDICANGFGRLEKTVYADTAGQPHTRIQWNAAKHNEDNNQIRYTSIALVVTIVHDAHNRLHDYGLVTRELLDMKIGKSTVGRWVRAAKGFEQEVVQWLQEPEHAALRGGYVWDNAFLGGQESKPQEKLGGEYAVAALNLLVAEGVLESPGSMTTQAFLASICAPMRVLELWAKLMVRRFGSVATESKAFHHLLPKLKTRAGLQKVKGAMDSKVPLHGVSEQNQGIQECYQLVKMMEAAKAGGLGPPETIRAQAEEKANPPKKESEQTETIADNQGSGGASEVADAEDSVVLQALAMSMGSIAGTDHEKAQKEVSRISNKLSSITFAHTYSELESTLRLALANCSPQQRLCLLIDAPTSQKSVQAAFLDMSFKLASLHKSNAVRVMVRALDRLPVLSHVSEKVQILWPKWNQMPVAIGGASGVQTASKKPHFLVVTGPKEDLKEAPLMVASRAYAKGYEQLRLRCTERDCPHRSKSCRDTLCAECKDPTEEINAEDKEGDNYLASLFEEADEVEGENTEETAEAILQAAQGTPSNQKKKKDYVVDLWPHAGPASHYVMLWRDIGKVAEGAVCVIFTTSAHPSPYLAALSLSARPIVYAERLKPHALAHGRELALKIKVAEEGTKIAIRKSVSASANPINIPLIEPPQVPKDVAMSPWDVTPSTRWFEGLDKMYRAEDLEKLVQQLIQGELAQGKCSLTPASPQGRGLVTTVALREGEEVIKMASLWYSSYEKLAAFLDIEGNLAYAESVVGPLELKNSTGNSLEVYAVQVGLAKYARHYQGSRKSANAFLKFDPLQGFNLGSLTIVASNRNGSGIRAGGEVCLNYGLCYDQEAFAALQASLTSPPGKSFKGPLNELFAKLIDINNPGTLETQPEVKDSPKRTAAQAGLPDTKATGTPTETKETPKRTAAQAGLPDITPDSKPPQPGSDAPKADAAKAVSWKAEVGSAIALPAQGAPQAGKLLKTLETPPVEVRLREGRVIFDSKASGPKKMMAGTLLAHSSADAGKLFLKTDARPGDFEWLIQPKTKVYVKEHGKVMTMTAALKDHYPQATGLQHYASFPAGSAPKKFEPQKAHSFIATDRSSWPAIIAAVQNCKDVSVIWSVVCDSNRGVVGPVGLALVSNGQILLKPGEYTVV